MQTKRNEIFFYWILREMLQNKNPTIGVGRFIEIEIRPVSRSLRWINRKSYRVQSRQNPTLPNQRRMDSVTNSKTKKHI